MAVTVQANLVPANGVPRPVAADNFVSFDIVGAPGAIVQISPEAAQPITNPITGEVLSFLDGVVVAVDSGGVAGTATALSGALPTAAPQTQLTDDVETLVYTFTQPDGSQVVVQAQLTGEDKISVQEFLDGFNYEELLVLTDTFNGEPFDGGMIPIDPFMGTDGDDNLIGDDDAQLITGLDGNDLLVGNGGNDTLIGGEGDDSMQGGPGNDQLWAGPSDTGNDSLNGETGNDTLAGGSGDDTLFGGDGADVLYGGSGNDDLYGGAGSDVIWAGTGNDLMYGGTENDTLGGGQGADTIFAGAGDDLVYGSTEADIVHGEAGNDTLFGGSGDDTLLGGAGDDELYSGAGTDVFVFAAGHGNDSIGGFETTGDNTIDVSALGLSGFSDLTLSQGASGVLVQTGEGSITLWGTALAEITEDDFIF